MFIVNAEFVLYFSTLQIALLFLFSNYYPSSVHFESFWSMEWNMLRTTYTAEDMQTFEQLRYSYPDERIMRRFEFFGSTPAVIRLPEAAWTLAAINCLVSCS